MVDKILKKKIIARNYKLKIINKINIYPKRIKKAIIKANKPQLQLSKT